MSSSGLCHTARYLNQTLAPSAHTAFPKPLTHHEPSIEENWHNKKYTPLTVRGCVIV